MPRSDATDGNVGKLLEAYPPEVQDLAHKARRLVSEIAPDAVEEVDWSSKMLGYTFIPGTYKGLILAVSPQKDRVNIIFAKGVEMLNEGLDDKGLLEGTGKQARHIKVRNEEILHDPTTRRLIESAVGRTPRSK
jgi:hypothetical protein